MRTESELGRYKDKMENKDIILITYSIVSIALLIMCAVAAYKGLKTLPILFFIAALAFLFTGNLNVIKKAKASKDGFEIEARDLIAKAEVTISEMQDLSKLVARTALSSIKRSGRMMDGYPEEEAEVIKEEFLTLLSTLNLSEKDIEEVLTGYNNFVEVDYVFLLLGQKEPQNWSPEDKKIRKDMRSNLTKHCPDPEEIHSLLERNNSLSENHREILEDYKYFRQNGRYRRPDAISEYRELRSKMDL